MSNEELKHKLEGMAKNGFTKEESDALYETYGSMKVGEVISELWAKNMKGKKCRLSGEEILEKFRR